jgi:hypothetical protein
MPKGFSKSVMACQRKEHAYLIEVPEETILIISDCAKEGRGEAS